MIYSQKYLIGFGSILNEIICQYIAHSMYGTGLCKLYFEIYGFKWKNKISPEIDVRIDKSINKQEL